MEADFSSLSKDDIANGDFPSTSSEFIDKPPSYEASLSTTVPDDPAPERELSEADENKILTLLREIVRKCTLANPMKRPTAREVLKMIQDSAPQGIIEEKFSLSDDEDDDDDDDDDFESSKRK